MYIDAHCHLEIATYGEELPRVIERAQAAKIQQLLAVGASNLLEGAKEALALAQAYPGFIYAIVGIHPHDAEQATPASLETLKTYLKEPVCLALGEIGLDYYYGQHTQKLQQQVFSAQLQLAKELAKPYMLHVRDAHDDALSMVKASGLPPASGVVHCFSGNKAEAKKYLEQDMYLSLSGIVTFKNALALQEAVAYIPTDRLLIETDAPYLAPVPLRGKRNEPAHLIHTAAKIAEIKKLSLTDIARITTRNAEDLFKIPLTTTRADTLVYPIRKSLYINLTNRCNLRCIFCPKHEKHDWWVRGHYLRLKQEHEAPEFLKIIEATLQESPDYEEIVFVGLGEPTLRLDTLLAIATKVREIYGTRYKLRIDTDGLGNLVHGYDITPKLATVIDSLSVSLNADNAETYAKICPSKYGIAAYEGVKSFIKAARQAGLEVFASIVGPTEHIKEENIANCRRIVENELQVKFKHRIYQEYG